MEKESSQVALFEQKSIRRVWHGEQWYFVLEDVVLALTDSSNVKDYINKMRRRDAELSKGYGQIVHTLDVQTKGGKQKMNCANTEGVLRIIQSIPSQKAEPFKQWLARIGKERIDEINNPEIAMARMKTIYEKKGYSKEWIEKRMHGIAIRQNLTDEWNDRGAESNLAYAILTNEIMSGTFDMTVKDYKDFKGLEKPHNLRDHMNDTEIVLTMLAEVATTNIHKARNSKGMPQLTKDAKDGGKIGKTARESIEKETGESVISGNNFLGLAKHKKEKLIVQNS